MQIKGKWHYENIPYVAVLFNTVFQITRIPGEKAAPLATFWPNKSNEHNAIWIAVQCTKQNKNNIFDVLTVDDRARFCKPFEI